MGYRHLLLVEGRNDQYVLRGLLRHHRVPCAIPDREPYQENAVVIDMADGIERLLARLLVILDDGDLERLGIVVDADTDMSARWQALRDVLRQFGGHHVPQVPDPDGTIVTLQQPYRELAVGIWVMPNNQIPGVLEDFCSFLIPDAESSLWQRAKDCVASIPQEQRHFPEASTPKAQIHTWLAWQEEPGQPLGIAVTARYLNAEAPYAQRLVNWIRRLFPVEDR